MGYKDMLFEYLGEQEGEERFWGTVKGCYVHWLRSVERVVNLLAVGETEYGLFMEDCKKMPFLMESEAEILLFFQ